VAKKQFERANATGDDNQIATEKEALEKIINDITLMNVEIGDKYTRVDKTVKSINRYVSKMRLVNFDKHIDEDTINQYTSDADATLSAIEPIYTGSNKIKNEMTLAIAHGYVQKVFDAKTALFAARDEMKMIGSKIKEIESMEKNIAAKSVQCGELLPHIMAQIDGALQDAKRFQTIVRNKSLYGPQIKIVRTGVGTAKKNVDSASKRITEYNTVADVIKNTPLIDMVFLTNSQVEVNTTKAIDEATVSAAGDIISAAGSISKEFKKAKAYANTIVTKIDGTKAAIISDDEKIKDAEVKVSETTKILKEIEELLGITMSNIETIRAYEEELELYEEADDVPAYIDDGKLEINLAQPSADHGRFTVLESRPVELPNNDYALIPNISKSNIENLSPVEKILLELNVGMHSKHKISLDPSQRNLVKDYISSNPDAVIPDVWVYVSAGNTRNVQQYDYAKSVKAKELSPYLEML